jgi:hypothetical protein
MMRLNRTVVMAGLVPAIHVFVRPACKTWMPATSAGMTIGYGKRFSEKISVNNK